MKKLLLPLTAALILLLPAACGGKEAPPPAPSSHLLGSSAGEAAGASSGAPDGSPAEAPGGSPAGEALPAPAITMQVQEYPGGDYARVVEIPLLTGEAGGIEAANAPFRRLAEERKRLLDQGSGEILEVRAFPFTRRDWVQALTVEIRYMSDGGAAVSSANYDAGAGAFVTPSEALERLSLTLEGLRDTLAAQALQPEEYETRLAELYEPSAFFVREDSSMVFFLRAYYEIVGNEDAMGPYAPVCYDSAAGRFSLGDPAAPLLAAGPDSLDPPLLYGRSEKLYQ